MRPLRLALIGDIHVYASRLGARRYLLSRRVLGHTNLMLTRRRRFNHMLLHPLMARVRAIQPDIALFSGDLSTTSHEDEFQDIARFIRPLADDMPVVLVPGNHDRYTFGSRRVRRIETIMQGLMPETFPELRPLSDRWKLLSLDSAAPRVLSSSGELGDAQLAAASRQIASMTPDQGLVVLCHYPVVEPPLTPRHKSHDLKERLSLRGMLEGCRAKVVFLHGHIHKPWALLPGPPSSAPFASINAGAPCMTSDKYPAGQGFWSIDLPDDPHDAVRLTHHLPRLTDAASISNGSVCVSHADAVNWDARRTV